MRRPGPWSTTPDGGLLLLWRHRFITDTWGWEIPAGRVDPGESPEQAARRETLEETGWRPGRLTPLVTYQPTNGLSDQRFNLFLADGAVHVGEPTDPGRVGAHRMGERRRGGRASPRRGEMIDGLSLTAVLYAFAFAGLALKADHRARPRHGPPLAAAFD